MHCETNSQIFHNQQTNSNISGIHSKNLISVSFFFSTSFGVDIMGYHKNNYLDQSLDDTIKNNRRRPPYEKRRPVPRANEPRRPDSKSRASINSRVGKVVIPPKRPIKEVNCFIMLYKMVIHPVIQRNTDLVINRRPKPNNHNSSSLDPSQIVITKTIKRDPQQKKQQAANLVINRNKRPTQEPARETPPPPPPPQPQPPVEKSRIVLLCNLDPRATAKDIGVTTPAVYITKTNPNELRIRVPCLDRLLAVIYSWILWVDLCTKLKSSLYTLILQNNV